MADTRPLAPCPHCGATASGYAIEPHPHSPSLMLLIPELPDNPGSYVIEGQCACGSGLIGADETEVVARWNRRAPQPSPAAQGDALDAARYRWLRERSSTMFVNISINGEGAEIAATLDSAVDAARKQGANHDN